MRPGRKESPSFAPIASCCVPGMVSALAVGACGVETIAGPEAAIEARNGAIVILTTKSGGGDKGDGTPGEPASW